MAVGSALLTHFPEAAGSNLQTGEVLVAKKKTSVVGTSITERNEFRKSWTTFFNHVPCNLNRNLKTLFVVPIFIKIFCVKELLLDSKSVESCRLRNPAKYFQGSTIWFDCWQDIKPYQGFNPFPFRYDTPQHASSRFVDILRILHSQVRVLCSDAPSEARCLILIRHSTESVGVVMAHYPNGYAFVWGKPARGWLQEINSLWIRNYCCFSEQESKVRLFDPGCSSNPQRNSLTWKVFYAVVCLQMNPSDENDTVSPSLGWCGDVLLRWNVIS